MADPYGDRRLYTQQYENAEALFDKGDIAQCLEEAKRNLTDPTLPPFHYMKNCILIASALDNWDDANVYRLAAEQSYETSLKKATDMQDENSLRALEGLRKELDTLRDYRLEDLENMYADEDAELEAMEEDEAEINDFEDAVGVAEAENELEEEAEEMELTILSGSPAPPASQLHNTSSTSHAASKTHRTWKGSYRKKNDIFNAPKGSSAKTPTTKSNLLSAFGVGKKDQE